ncbi:uncharacterized protein LOC132256083 [Phlebotomus argentipes]|uniref:uncharacterized protein LOC132256083 n=1 Tax=Phlebotomus argentipes TaxID=94469 RepID=UPI002893142D|nr:uncharacterized protein LOC132256083 [Phlebotomus argentipes]
MIVSRLLVKNHPVLIRVAEKCDHDRALQFLRKHYYPFDPSSHGRVSKRQSPEDEATEMASIDSGASVLAFTNDHAEELIAVSLARRFREEHCREHLKKLQQLSSIRGYPNDLEGVIFVEDLKLRAQICRKFNIDEALYLALTCVRKDFQGFSLGKTLMMQRLERGREMGLSVAFGLAVTNGGVKLTESFNFQPIHTMKFQDYKDYRGLSIYSTFPPEAIARVAATQIGQRHSVT